MATQSLGKRRVLFVDDEQPFLDLIGQAMEAYSHGNWEVQLASTTSKALSILQQGPVHLVVVDIHMPVVDGVQFLKLLQRKYPNVPRAVLTGDATDEHRESCQANGAEMFLEKPRCPEGLEIVFATLDELAKWQPENGFQGVLRRVGMQDVLQMECLARNSVILEISGNGESGKIYIEQGSIVHAHVGKLVGDAAFNRLLSLAGGQFNHRAFSEPPERSLSGAWEFLLMEAARMKDETLNSQANEETSNIPLDQVALPVGESDTTQIFFKPKSEDSACSTPAEPGAELDTVLFDTDKIPTLDTNPEQTPATPPRIEELLIVTQKGEILHNWQCSQPQERAELISLLGQKSKQICQGMPVGAMERVELEGLDSRWVMRLEGDQVYLLHALREQPGVSLEAMSA
jgi:CheY-like chemotaxis protein